MTSHRPTRRTILGGAGAAVALPFLESLVTRRRAFAQAAAPKRLLFYFIPCGIHMRSWTPAAQGAGYALTPILEPLAMLKNDFLVLTGLANLPARPDGPGDHASGTGAFLTCAHPKKTDGADIQNGISVDQVAAEKVGKATRFPSLQLGIDGGSSAGGCDSGYSCAYARNVSWSGPATPLPKVTNPQTVFDRLFEGLDPQANREELERRRRYKTSVLDYATGDAMRLQQRLGRTDRRKVDEYLTGVRELERRVAETPGGPSCTPGMRPAAMLDYQQHVKLMSDLMVLAFQCDLTRTISFMLGNAGSGRSYPFLGVSGGHHQLSHHQSNQANFDALQKIDIWEVGQLAYLLQKMKSVSEGAGTLLDNTAVFYSSEIEDGDAHRHTNLPVIVAGRGGGAFNPGRHVVYPANTPLANLFVSMLASAGVTVDKFGNSTGPLANL